MPGQAGAEPVNKGLRAGHKALACGGRPGRRTGRHWPTQTRSQNVRLWFGRAACAQHHVHFALQRIGTAPRGMANTSGLLPL